MDQEQLWLLIARKLSGEATEEELQELESQLHLHPDVHYSLQPIYDLWHTENAGQPSGAEEAFAKHVEQLQHLGIMPIQPENADPFHPVSASGKRFRTAGWVGLILLMAVGSYALLNRKNATKPLPAQESRSGEIITKNGSKTKFLLPDGSTVWLNAGSNLGYDSTYGENAREVSLKGEAFFDVVKNAGHPFIIHTGKLNIRVLGTAFNVKSYPGEKTIETSLIRGSVEITFNDRSSKKIILRANQKLIVANEGFSVPGKNRKIARLPQPAITIDHINRAGKDSIVVETAWMENRLIFEDESFMELARKMERWYGVRIDFEDPKADSLHFTGIFSKENVEQALNALRVSAPFKYRIQNGHITIAASPE